MLTGLKRLIRGVPSPVTAVLWELDELARPSVNENGARAVATDTGIVAAARTFVQAVNKVLTYRPEVAPTENGKLQLVWYRGLTTLKLEFVSPRTVHLSRAYGDTGVEEEATFPVADMDRAAAFIRGFWNGTSRDVLSEPELPVVRRGAFLSVAE